MDNDNGVNLEPNYIWEIQDWAKERGLDKSNNDKQLIKLQEELGELAEAHNKEFPDKVVDSLGDMFVVMTIYALQRGIDIGDCIEEAYNTIKDRKGKMIDGVFIKEADL